MPPTAPAKKAPPEKKYKCQFCSRPFSRSEHRSRHERSHTKERPFKCMKCRSTFVRRDLLLRHDRTVHAKDDGVPLASETKRRGKARKPNPMPASATASPIRPTATRTTPDETSQSSKAVTSLSPADYKDSPPSPPPPPHTSPPHPSTQRLLSTRRHTPSNVAPSITIDPAKLDHMDVGASDDDINDLETAAMLMTDFKTKAAASVGHFRPAKHPLHAAHSLEDKPYQTTPERGNLTEPFATDKSASSTAFLTPNQYPLWEPFMSPRSYSPASSMSSSPEGQFTSDSHGNRPSHAPNERHHISGAKTHMSTTQSRVRPLAGMKPERDGYDTVTPPLHSLVNNVPSGRSTPNSFGGFPFQQAASYGSSTRNHMNMGSITAGGLGMSSSMHHNRLNDPMLAPQSPGNLSNSYVPSPALPSISSSQFAEPCPIPQLVSEDERSAIMASIEDPSGESLSYLPESFAIPPLDALNRYIKAYFCLYQPNCPFLHPATFIPHRVAPPLLFAVLSIGALYEHESDIAILMHVTSRLMVNRLLAERSDFDSRLCPLWAMQATLLNMYFGSWGGDAKGLEWTCSIKSLVANMVSGSRYQLKSRIDTRIDKNRIMPTYDEWLDEESSRRTYFAVYIFFGLLTLVFNHAPGLGSDEIDDLELPCDEKHWNMSRPSDGKMWNRTLDDIMANAPSRAPITHARSNKPKLQPFSLKVREAHDILFQGEAPQYSAFAARIMVTALFLEVWFHKRSALALQDVVREFKLRLALDAWEASLALCDNKEKESVSRPDAEQKTGQYSQLHANVPFHRRDQASSTTPPSDGNSQTQQHQDSHPLIFSSMSIFRVARVRLFVDIKCVQEALRYHSPFEIAASMSVARDAVDRTKGSALDATIWECCSFLETTSHSDRVKNVTRSVEPSLCGMEMIVILTMWLRELENAGRAVEQDPGFSTPKAIARSPNTHNTSGTVNQSVREPSATPAEIELYYRVRNIISALNDDLTESVTSPDDLAVAVAFTWSDILERPEADLNDNVSIWGIAGVMAESFRLHAQALDKDRNDCDEEAREPENDSPPHMRRDYQNDNTPSQGSKTLPSIDDVQQQTIATAY